MANFLGYCFLLGVLVFICWGVRKTYRAVKRDMAFAKAARKPSNRTTTSLVAAPTRTTASRLANASFWSRLDHVTTEWIDGKPKRDVVCQHCQMRGHVRAKGASRRVDGNFFTIKKPVLQLRCSNCEMKWVIDA